MDLRPFESFLDRRGFFFGWLLSVAAGAATFFRLREFADPTGLNGYFYLKQTKTLAESASFYFGDHSLAFLPLVLLRWLTGSELLAFQLGTALALGFACLGASFLVNQTPARGREKAVAQILLVIALFSSSFFVEFALNFFKNLCAAGLLLWSAAWMLRGNPRLAAVFFLLGFFTHKSVALVGAVYFSLWLGSKVLRAAREKEGLRRAALWACAGAALAAIFLGLFLWHFPKAGAFLEFALRSFSGPGARLQWWRGTFSYLPQRGAEVVAWAGILLAMFWGGKALPPVARRLATTGAILFLLAIHPFQAPGPATLGYRQLLLLPIFLYPLAALGLYQASPWRRLAAFLPLLLVFHFTFAPFGFPPRAVAKQVRPYSRLLAGVEKVPELVEPLDHLVSHHGLEFFVDYVTDIRSRSFLAAKGFTGRRFRIAYLPDRTLGEGPARDEVAQTKLLDLGHGYALFSEEDWQELVNRVRLPPSWKNYFGDRPAHVYE